MYRMALCDDNKVFLDMLETRIRHYCKNNNIDMVINSFNSSDMLADITEKGKIYDAYLLDIEMNGYSGIDVAKMIHERSGRAQIVFLTAYVTYAVDACGMNIFRYVLKEKLVEDLPILLKDLLLALQRMKNDKLYLIHNQRKYLKISQSDIVYVYKNQKNSVFKLIDGREEYDRIALQDAYEKLDNEEMFNLDRGVIINLFHIQRIQGNCIKMDNGEEFFSSAAHIAELKRVVSTYWSKRI